MINPSNLNVASTTTIHLQVASGHVNVLADAASISPADASGDETEAPTPDDSAVAALMQNSAVWSTTQHKYLLNQQDDTRIHAQSDHGSASAETPVNRLPDIGRNWPRFKLDNTQTPPPVLP